MFSGVKEVKGVIAPCGRWGVKDNTLVVKAIASGKAFVLNSSATAGSDNSFDFLNS